MQTLSTDVLGLSKQQAIELAGDLLLLAKGKLDDLGVILRCSDSQIVLCLNDNFRDICNQLEQSNEELPEADKDGLTEVVQEAYLAEEDTEVHP